MRDNAIGKEDRAEFSHAPDAAVEHDVEHGDGGGNGDWHRKLATRLGAKFHQRSDGVGELGETHRERVGARRRPPHEVVRAREVATRSDFGVE